MSTLVVGYHFTSLWSYELRLLLDASNDPFSGELEVHDGDGLLVISGSDDGSLVADVLNISSTEARSEGC